MKKMTITLIPHQKKDKIDSELQEEIRNRLLSKKKSFKVIKAVMFDIDNHEIYILAVGYKNKTIETENKWNQLNLIDIKYMLGTNHRLPLSHMDKSYIWLEETNQRINEFSIGYMMDTHFNMKKYFREKVKVFLKTHILYINHDIYQ